MKPVYRVFLPLIAFLGMAPLAWGNASDCTLSTENRAFIQEALGIWKKGAQDLLDVDPTALPWSVMFDRECAWHLAPDPNVMPGLDPIKWSPEIAGETVRVAVSPHDGEVRLPGGGLVPAQGLAFAGVYDEGAEAYFAMALLDVWRQNPNAAAHNNLRDIILGVVSHEIVHTLQLPAVVEATDALRDRYEMPEDLNDDMVEQRFAGNKDFSAAIDREIDLFFQAARADNRENKIALVRQGLEAARTRRARFFTGENAFYGPIEDLFLNMEGVGTWVSYRLGYGTEAEGEELSRKRNSWTQDEGLALMLLIEALVPGWRERVLSELAAPFDLLKEATSGSAGSIPASGR